jgi:hypothetical protein
MVIGALIAGVLVGLLVPSPKPPAATGSTPATQVSTEKPEPKVKRDLAAATPRAGEASSQAATEAKPAKQDSVPCSQQTWPYYSASCIDRSAPMPSFQAATTRPADPSVALRDDSAKQQEKKPVASDAPKQSGVAKQEEKKPAAEPARTASETARTAQPSPQAADPAPRGAATQPARASNGSADAERQLEQQRPRQQRAQPRFTRVDPPDDFEGESPRILLRRDGSRIYIMPEGQPVPQGNGYWRSW